MKPRPDGALEQLLDAAAEQLMTPAAAERLKRIAARQRRAAPGRTPTRSEAQAAAWANMAEAFTALAERAAFMAHEATDADDE